MRSKIFLFLWMTFLCVSLISQDAEILSADLLYNQGNTAFNEERFGDAVYHYEKALILDPGSNDILVNLELSKERLEADIVELDSFFLAKWWNGLSNTFMPGTWKILSVLILLGLLGLIYLWFFRNRDWSSTKVFSGLGALSFLLLLTILAGSTRSNMIYSNPFAVLGGDAQSLYQGPDLVSEKIKPVVNGVKVKVLDSSGEWYKVSTMDSEQGWIEKKNVRLLAF